MTKLARKESVLWPPRWRTLSLGLFVVTVASSVASLTLLDRGMLRHSLFDLANFTGPTARSLLDGGGLTFCSDGSAIAPNVICFHAGRMPVAPLTVAAGVRMFGDSFVRVSLFKVVLFLLPLEFAIYLACKRMPATGWRRVCCVLLLLAPFGMTIFIANVVNLQVEEDYAYSLIACAFAIVLFGPLVYQAGAVVDSTGARPGTPSHLFYSILFLVAVDGLYLSKSSLVLAVAALAGVYLAQQRGVALRTVMAVAVIAAPVGWAMYAHHASGRYSIGTSLDGVNLHKGNDPIFLDHYPPPPLTSLDDYDGELNRGLHFSDEWSLNEYHFHAALAYIRSHPRETLEADWRKFRLLCISVTKYGSSDPRGLRRVVEKGGLVLFRAIFWSAVVYSAFGLFVPGRRGLRYAAAAYLYVVAACCAPYLAGFGYTRHASILIYPACLMWCRILSEEEPAQGRRDFRITMVEDSNQETNHA